MGSEHDCKSKSKNRDENGIKGHDISVEILLKRLQSLGITIDLEKLRNANI